MNLQLKRWHFIASLLFALTFIGCEKEDNSGENGSGGNNGGSGGNGGSQSNKVSISAMAFSPSTITIKSGVTVTWTNNDAAPHTVTADDNSFTGGTLNKGQTFSHTFTDAGTFDYHCGLHPAMTGSVVVQ